MDITKLLLSKTQINFFNFNKINNENLYKWLNNLLIKYNIKKNYEESYYLRDYKKNEANIKLLLNNGNKINNEDLLALFLLDRQNSRYINFSYSSYILRDQIYLNHINSNINYILFKKIIFLNLKTKFCLDSIFFDTMVINFLHVYLQKENISKIFDEFIYILKKTYSYDKIFFENALNNNINLINYFNSLNDEEFLIKSNLIINYYELEFLKNKLYEINPKNISNDEKILLWFNKLKLNIQNDDEIIFYLNNLNISEIKLKTEENIKCLIILVWFYFEKLKNILLITNKIFIEMSKLKKISLNNKKYYNLFYLKMKFYCIRNDLKDSSKFNLIENIIYKKEFVNFNFNLTNFEKLILYYLKKFNYNIVEYTVIDDLIQIDALEKNLKIFIEINGIYHFNYNNFNYNIYHILKMKVFKYIFIKYKFVNINYFEFNNIKNDVKEIEIFFRKKLIN